MSRPKLEGTLEEFYDWATGKSRGEGSGVHYHVVDAIERFQMFRASRKQSHLKSRLGEEAEVPS